MCSDGDGDAVGDDDGALIFGSSTIGQLLVNCANMWNYNDKNWSMLFPVVAAEAQNGDSLTDVQMSMDRQNQQQQLLVVLMMLMMMMVMPLIRYTA